MRLLILILSVVSFGGYAQTTNTGTIKVKKPEQTKEIPTSDIVIFSDAEIAIVDVMPEFPGGDIAMNQFIAKETVYPKNALENGTQGTCYLTFNVNADGSLSDIKLLRGVTSCPECDLEAIRVVKLMPKWKPGTKNGIVVPVRMNVPIKFKLR